MATIPTNPDWFVYDGPILSRYEPFPVLTGTAYQSTNTLYFFNPIVLPQAVAFRKVNLLHSLNASVPGATSLASTGSEGYTYGHTFAIFARQDWSANSTNLTCITTAGAGLTASLGYSSTSQQFGLSWLTDASGGTSAYTTTSNDGNWSSFATGPKFLQVPIAPLTLSAGEYILANRLNSTSATSNSNVTLLSVSRLHVAPQVVAVGVLGGSATIASSQQMGIGLGVNVVSTVTTDNTMAASVIGSGGLAIVYQNFSNA